MPDESICFEASPALLAFRQLAGDANRCLNTILVGLQTLKVTNPIRPPDLVIPWTKPAVAAEWEETRLFALRGTLVAVVDGLDQYLRVLSKVPGLAEPSLDIMLNARRIPGEGRKPSMAERLKAIDDTYPGVMAKEDRALIALLAVWRNRFVHGDRKAKLSLAETRELVRGAKYFKEKLGGVNIRATLKRFEGFEAPTLSDVACMTACTHRAVNALDAHLLYLQTGKGYAIAFVKFHILQADSPSHFMEDLFQHGGKRSAGKIHSMMLHNGANHHETNRKGHAPALSRKELHAVLGIGRNRASELFGIARPDNS